MRIINGFFLCFISSLRVYENVIMVRREPDDRNGYRHRVQSQRESIARTTWCSAVQEVTRITMTHRDRCRHRDVDAMPIDAIRRTRDDRTICHQNRRKFVSMRTQHRDSDWMLVWLRIRLSDRLPLPRSLSNRKMSRRLIRRRHYLLVFKMVS